MNTRRTLLALLGMSPVAGMAAGQELAATVASPAVAAALALANPQPPSPIGETIFGKVLGNKLTFLKDLAAAEMYSAQRARIEGLDPDIAALKSCSRAYKVAKQLQRDREDDEFLARAQRTIWGDMIE